MKVSPTVLSYVDVIFSRLRAGTMPACALILLMVFLNFGVISAHAEIIDVGSWQVTEKFKGKKARKNLSGAVCAENNGADSWCLIVNDDKRYAQFFSMPDRQVKPGRPIWLLQKYEHFVKLKEIDAEAAAYHGGYFYVTGSHGLTRKKARFKSSMFFVSRFPVNPQTGKPGFKLEEKKAAREILSSGKLIKIIQKQNEIARFFLHPLNENGANIEGMVVDGKNMFFGFRGPNIDGNAFVLSVNESAIFSDEEAQSKLHKLKLGKKIGIRDLTMTSKGILVLAGPVNGEGGEGFSIHLWQPNSGILQKLGDLPVVVGGKPEGLLLLGEALKGATHTFNALIFHDGLKNGAPHEYNLIAKE